MGKDAELDDFLDEMMSQWQMGEGQLICDLLLRKMSLAEEALVSQYGNELRDDLREILSLQLEYCRLCIRHAYLVGCGPNSKQGGNRSREKIAPVPGRSTPFVVLNRVRSEIRS